MSLPPEFLDDLRARIGLAAIVGRRVKLSRAGREWKGCCPFHNEKTPSFYVNEEKGFYHCFGCGAHGDALGFVMAADGLGFMEAVTSLAAEAGLEVPKQRADAVTEKRSGLSDLVGAAGEWFRERLAASEGAEARAYLARRGVSAGAAVHFALGFAPDSRDALSKALLKRLPGVTPERLLEAGLTGETEERRYDRFRGRLIFPIHDARGRPVGFGGRALGDAQPKYLNSADGPLFHKGRLLYNQHRAAPVARRSGRLLVVEGYMDVIGLAGAGIAEAVAPLGTALTEEQMELCWRIVPEPVLAFDGDAAGTRAGVKAATRALPLLAPGRSLSFVQLPPGQDPDDLARGGGKAAVEALLATARPLERFLYESEQAASPVDTPERRAAFRARLKALAGEIREPEIARDYLSTWLRRAEDSHRPPRRQWQPRAGGRRGQWEAPIPPARAETRAAAGAAPAHPLGMLMKALSLRPELAERHAEMLVEIPISIPSLAIARDRLLAGEQCAEMLAGYRPLFANVESADEVAERIGRTLASIAESHHMGAEDQRQQDVSSDDGFAAALKEAEARRAAKADTMRRLAALAIEADPSE